MFVRPNLSKKLRFEVFKRDKFCCRYCGRRPPDVVLVVDHVEPVSKGGSSDILNLVTSCDECNSGKGATLLSNDAVLHARYSELERLQEQRDQLSMMLDWQRELSSFVDDRLDQVIAFWLNLAPGYDFSPAGRALIAKILDRYEVDEACNAMRISAAQYLRYDGAGSLTADSWEIAVETIEAVARVERQAREDPDAKTIAYTIGILRKRLAYMNNEKTAQMIRVARSWDCTPEEIYRVAGAAHSWTKWRSGLNALIDQHGYNETQTSYRPVCHD